MACDQIDTAWTFHAGDLGSADVQALVEEHFRAMRAISPPVACNVLPAASLAGPDVTFWSLREHGRLLGIGALKALSSDDGEIKSMRTASPERGRGVGAAILAHIVAEARRRGYTRLSLETGATEPFAAARRLYEREGFEPCGPFAGYADTPFTRFFTRRL